LGDYKVLSRTIDDAAGEAFDKSASMLGLPYPGGPGLAKLADSVAGSPYVLPVVMRERPEMSFSGLKTAVRTLVARQALQESISAGCVRTEFGFLTEQLQKELAYTVQRVIVDSLMFKIERAVQNTGVRRIALTGGVAANRALRAAVASISKVELLVPEIRHCTDNAAMIAHVGYLRKQAGLLTVSETYVESVATVLSRWPLDSIAAVG
jgi:N6-L-threonylcarbamoyladenine synthase